MRKLFKIKISELGLEELFKKIEQSQLDDSLEQGTYDIELNEQKISGLFWTREKVTILNELDIHASAEPITIYRLNRFLFTLQHVKNVEYLLNIESSSKSIKPLINHLQSLTGTGIFISNIDIDLFKLASHFLSSKLPLIKVIKSYASNQPISLSEKITFSLYSQDNAIISAQKLMQTKNLKFDRIQIQSSSQGDPVTLDIKSNCLYNISHKNSKAEEVLISYILKNLDI